MVIISLGSSGGAAGNDGIGVVLGLVTAVLYASGVLLQKVALRSVDAMTATYLGCVVGAVVLTPFAPSFVTETASAPGSAIAVVVYLGVFPTAIAFSTWAYALSQTNAGKMTATTLAVPAIATLISWSVLGELPTILAMSGGALCLVGVAITRRR